MITGTTSRLFEGQITKYRNDQAKYTRLAIQLMALSWPGAAAWMNKNARDKDELIERFIAYMVKNERYPSLKEIEEAKIEFSDPLVAFEAALQMERDCLGSLESACNEAWEGGEISATTMLQAVIAEQDQIIRTLAGYCDQVARADDAFLKMFDLELGKLAKTDGNSRS